MIPAQSMFCPECGAPTKNNQQEPTPAQVQQEQPRPLQNQVQYEQPVHQVAVSPANPKNMVTWKIVSGILSIVFSFVMFFQSCAVNALQNISREFGTGSEEEIGGSAGVLVALLMLAVGITSVVGRRSRGVNIAIMILCGIGMIFGFSMAGEYTDLIIWTCWLAVLFVMALIALLRFKKANGR